METASEGVKGFGMTISHCRHVYHCRKSLFVPFNDINRTYSSNFKCYPTFQERLSINSRGKPIYYESTMT